MLIPDLTLTPGLTERLRACGDERLGPLVVTACWSGPARGATSAVMITGPGGEELAEHEQRRVEGVLAAHRVEAF